MALSLGLLIRMRSQVQVLAGPLPNPAGQSAAGSELGTLAAGLGRAGAARPSPPAPPVTLRVHPPGRQARRRPPTVVAPPAQGRQPRVRCRQLALPPAPVPTAPPPATGAPTRRPGRPGRSAGKRGRRGGPPPPGSATDPPRTYATWAASPASRPPRPSIEPSTARQSPGPSPVPVVRVARPPRPWSPTPPPEHGRRRTRPDPRLDSRRLDTGRLDSRRPSAGPLDDQPR